MKTALELHQEAKQRAKTYRSSQYELLSILVHIDSHKIYQQFGYANLKDYCMIWLTLSENDTYALCAVTKTIAVVPEIKTLIDKGDLHLSNARRIVSVITPENKKEWLGKACTLSQNDLRREIVTQFPEQEAKTRIKPITENRSRLEVGISTELEAKLKRVCDLLSQKEKKNISIEAALDFLTKAYLDKHDPIKKAERNLGSDRNVPPVKTGRAIPSHVAHSVSLRDQRQCQYRYPNQQQCQNSRWVESHHLKQVAHGGLSTTDNLITLCSAHHKFQHSNYFLKNMAVGTRQKSVPRV